MKQWIKAAFIVASLGFSPLAAMAQEASESPLSAELVVQRVEFDEQNNDETLAPAETASPGDLLQYTGQYTNVSDQPLNGLIINGPIPPNTVFSEAGRAASREAIFEVLIEGEPWQELPAFKTVVAEDGTEERVPAEPSDYEEVRWRLPEALAPEATLVTVYRVEIAQ